MLNQTKYIWIYGMFCFYGNLDFKILYRADDNKLIECIYFILQSFILFIAIYAKVFVYRNSNIITDGF